MSKKQPCLHCAINKAIDEFLVEQKVDPATQETQRWVLHSIASAVSDRIMAVHPGVRVIAVSEFIGQAMAYVESASRDEVALNEGEMIH